MIPKRQFVPTHTKSRRLLIVVGFFVVIVCFAVTPIRNGIRSVFGFVGTGLVGVTSSTSDGASSFFDNFRFKRNLVHENENLKAQLAEQDLRLEEYALRVQENAELKSLLDRNDKIQFTLASILAKPPRSLYDTLLIDGGEQAGLIVGQMVYAHGRTPIGVIENVRARSALVRLFSTSGEKVEARLEPSHVDVTLVGRGGGDFYVTVPHDLTIGADSVVVSKDIYSHVVARFVKIVSDERDPFQTLLFSSPINMQELSFVQVKK